MEIVARKKSDAIASPERLTVHEEEQRPEHALADRIFVLMDQTGLCAGVLHARQNCISIEADRGSGVSGNSIAGGAALQPIFAIGGLIASICIAAIKPYGDAKSK